MGRKGSKLRIIRIILFTTHLPKKLKCPVALGGDNHLLILTAFVIADCKETAIEQ